LLSFSGFPGELITASFAAEIIGHAVLAKPHSLPLGHEDVAERVLDEFILRSDITVPFSLDCGVRLFV
jgi:hypothetical protein